MDKFRKEQGGDPRFAVLPGVLHSNSIWGNGTTEYALDALLAAPHQVFVPRFRSKHQYYHSF